ncbi:MAG: efflux transporter periplasmic adaptor subunit [Phascolarctobacterium sp.]|nr:MAG: efflux transporter periplasmic adaptor subunit [Phascolarctobacterium sp.]
MLNFLRKNRSARAAAVAVAVAVSAAAFSGCGGEKQAAPQATLVRSMQVIKRDTPLVYDYTGFVQAQQEMELKAQVSGQITGKYFNGGETVQQGQVLYTIDPRTYRANLLQAQANLANARAALANASVDAERYTKLYEQSAVSKQVLDNAIMARDQAQASVNAQEALLENAQIDMSETSVTAPFTGRIDTTALEVGNYVTDGQTTMATISNTDPVFVEFSIAEPEYLKLANAAVERGEAAPLENLSIVLADGSTYQLPGRITEVNRALSNNTGTLTVKALFENPNRVLLPGMFAHVQATAGTRDNAILIPQRAVTEMMYKKFVYVIGADNTVEMREVTLGPRVGRLWMVESGLNGDETLVVEGTGKITAGALVNPEPMTEAELDTTIADRSEAAADGEAK